MVNSNLTIENAEIMFKNFSGEATKYNRKGDRNFCVRLDNELAAVLKNDGWSIKYLKQRDPDEEPRPYMSVKVNFGAIPPQIVLVTRKNKKVLTEENVDILDWAELERVDLIIRPYNWNVDGKSGVKGYLKTGYFKIAEDRFASMYDDIPEEE